MSFCFSYPAVTDGTACNVTEVDFPAPASVFSRKTHQVDQRLCSQYRRRTPSRGLNLA
jgi:hypothetical protein